MKAGYLISGIKASDGGIYQYSIYILKMLLRSDEIEKVYLFYSSDQIQDFSKILADKKVNAIRYEPSGKFYNFRKRLSEFFLTRYYLKGRTIKRNFSWYQMLNPDQAFFKKFDCDFIHVPRQHAPAYSLPFPVLISMHDLQQLHFPEFFTPLERIYKAIRYYTSLGETDHVIVSYPHVKADINKYFGNIKAGVSVCPVPMDQDWVSEKPVPSANELMKKFRIPAQIILTPAATWEHKNHIAVLRALHELKKQGRNIFWVSTGNKTHFYKKIEEKINEFGLADQVLFTGIVSDDELVGLYKMAGLVVIPTLYEAGSGPLFEAMRYSRPVICSNVTSLPDTIGDKEFIFDPGNTTQIASMIIKGLEDEDFIKRNLANSAQRISYFQNSDPYPAFSAAYREAIKKHSQK